MRLDRRLNSSYQRLCRDRHIKARELFLKDAEYRLWDLFTALYDWDPKHLETYGKIEATDIELGEILNCSDAKICRTRNSLIKKGVIKQLGESQYEILISFERRTDNKSLQEKVAKLQERIASAQHEVAKLQEEQPQTGGNSIVSYKDKYRLVRGDEEYRDIWEEIGKPEDFTLEDMKWIDSNA